ncbi:MAG: xanthine/uracil/vitamin C permease [Sphaerochaeta associata]|uniref:xanthine/uracil/vitamin C permease n=1 Tax=Sphaerochaeta associata TaxID=1129264 RepID=UPI002B21FF0F|nr:xanthine/uracil/vitamin C permease [Sphaerochaeta associata]MEA5108376.1 xanthine/uracil/vitamin C permease [Sphaerochaeta associata]
MERTLGHAGLFRPGDLGGVVYSYFGNIINFIIIAYALQGIGWPDSIIYGRVIPGLAVGLMLGCLAYAWQGYRLAKKTGRKDVTALPSGVSTPAMFVYLYGVIYPLHYSGLSPEMCWMAATAACFLGGFIEMLGGFIGPFIRRLIPRVAMLGTVAGIGLVWMATAGLFEVYHDPILGMPVVVIAIIGLIGGYVFKKRIPMLLVSVVFGIVWALFLGRVQVDTSTLGVSLPVLSIGAVFQGFKYIIPFLSVIIPIEVYNFIETMDNVESAIAAGDEYNVGQTQIIDGVCTMVSALFGSIVPNTVWLGHAGLKKSETGISYSWISAILYALSSVFGLYGFMNSLMPAVVASITFLWCAMLMLVQAYTDVPRRHGAALAIALIPHLADALYTYVRDALGAFGIYLEETLTMNSSDEISQAMITYGVVWKGVVAMHSGAIITSILWATVVAFIIDRRLDKASIAFVVASVLSFFGFIHSPALVVGVATMSFPYAVGYLLAAVICYAIHLGHKKIMDVPRRYDYV